MKNLKFFFNSFCFLATVGFMPTVAFACQTLGPRSLGLQVNYEHQVWNTFQSPDQLQDAGGEISLFNCRENYGKYLHLTLGVEELAPNAAASFIGLNPDFEMISCSVQGGNTSIIPAFDQAEFKNRYNKKNKFISECLEMTVEDLGTPQLTWPSTQVNCKPKRLSPNKALMVGPACSFNITPSSQFRILPRINSTCLDRSKLVQMGINPQDFTARLNSYIAPVTQGDQSMVALGSHALQIVLAPGSEFSPLSEDQGDDIPRWPATWQMPQIEMAKMIVSQRGSSMYFNPTFLMSTKATSACVDGLCTSSGNFSVPLFPSFELNEIKGKKKEYVHAWQDGMVVPAHYWGLLRSLQDVRLPTLLEANKEYELAVTFGTPREDYLMAKRSGKSAFPSFRLSKQGGQVIGVIPNLGNQSSRIVPTLPLLNGASVDSSGSPGNNSTFVMSNLWSSLGDSLGESFWPVDYTQVCNQSGSNCRSSNLSYHLKFYLRFMLVKVEGDNVRWEIKPLSLEKDSSLYPSLKSSVVSLSELACQ